MHRILVSLRKRARLLAIAILAVGVTAANAQAPAGSHRPAGVPGGYLLTPSGYFHPSCVRQLAEGDTLLKDELAIRHADGTLENIAVCNHPHYRTDGKIAEDTAIIATNTGDTAVTAPRLTWVEAAGASSDWSYGELTATWVVPPAPASYDGQIIAFWPGLEELGDTGGNVLQPLLAWNEFPGFGNEWAIASANCCVAGIQWYSTPKGVAPGDTIVGTIRNNCAAGTLSCGTWDVTALDVTSGQASLLSNTSSYEQTFNQAFSGVLEVNNISRCSDYPVGGSLTFTNVRLYGDHFQLLSDPGWAYVAVPGPSVQCNYSQVISADSVTLEYGPQQIEAAFQANTSDLWFWSSPVSGRGDAKLGMMPGTSPSIGINPSSGPLEGAFQANTGSLWLWSSAGGPAGPQNLGMMARTSPSLAVSPYDGTVAVAVQANTGSLWLWQSASGTAGDLKLGLMAGTSPSIAITSDGTVEIAFQANTGSLWLWKSGVGGVDLKLGMMAGTSPSITVAPNGTTEIAFQANTGVLWLWSSGGGPAGDINLGMMAGTSPSIAAFPNSNTVKVGFQANTGSLYLWTSGSGSVDTKLGMMEGSSPSIAAPASALLD